MGTSLLLGKRVNPVSWGGGRGKAHYYEAVFIFKIVCGMKMSQTSILTWRGLAVTLV